VADVVVGDEASKTPENPASANAIQRRISSLLLSLVSMWKENRFGWPLRGIIWFTVAIVGFCAAIALLAGYVQEATT